ncbi:tyrosine-type recombinase/integrase [Brevundimonas sp.]|uniref:tyrosine-type recombinase/integrase n=1 Tax=Brevundimonas sp. TaxID=1871086 RepID=UPI00289AB800|nr:tyrosine-type recombinase/integrase [Brevundimonas sp.]
MPLRLLKAKNATSKLIEWRDSYSETSRKADYLFQVLKRVFEFGVERRYIDENPIKGVKNIYVCDRSDVVVEEHELQAILQVSTSRARLAIRLAAATGLRRGDLVNLRWDQVHSDRIVISTSKSRRKTYMVVPLMGDALKVISELREEREFLIRQSVFPSPFVLTTVKGVQWKPDSVTQAFIRAAQKVGIEKRLHDLRGTAATRYASAGVPETDIALFMGWEPNHVASIMRHYVNKNAIGNAAINRLEQSMFRG